MGRGGGPGQVGAIHVVSRTQGDDNDIVLQILVATLGAQPAQPNETIIFLAILVLCWIPCISEKAVPTLKPDS